MFCEKKKCLLPLSVIFVLTFHIEFQNVKAATNIGHNALDKQTTHLDDLALTTVEIQNPSNVVGNTQIDQNLRRSVKDLKFISSSRAAGLENPRAFGLLTLTAVLAIPIIIIVLILIFLPIPVAIGTARRMAKEIVTSDECLERVACDLLKVSNEMEFDARWIQKWFRSSRRNAIWIERVSRGMHTNNCDVLACDPIMAFSKSIIRKK